MPVDRDDAPLDKVERAVVTAIVAALLRRGVVRMVTADEQPEVAPRHVHAGVNVMPSTSPSTRD